MNIDMILICISEKTKRKYSKKNQKVLVINNIIKYIKKIIKNLHTVSLENLGIRNLKNLIHDG